ncbi:hypothetical protein B0H14DRAFT_3436375 [Mycena olivaceomarginata]|nr:hypothetical protein B0H14DRAFT_3436375 [Mycena olivaceomarginata]
MARRSIPPSATPAPTNYSHAHRSARRTRDEKGGTEDMMEAAAVGYVGTKHGPPSRFKPSSGLAQTPPTWPRRSKATQQLRPTQKSPDLVVFNAQYTVPLLDTWPPLEFGDPRVRCSPFSCCVTQRRRTTARVLLSPVPTTSSTPFDSPHVNVEHHAHGPSPQLLLSRHSILSPSHSPSLAVLCAHQSRRSRVGRVCWYGAIPGAERALRIVQAHMSASFTATSSSTSLRFPLLSFFPPPVLLDRFADAPLPVYPRSSSFLSALSLVLAPAAGNPPRKPQIGCINAGGRLSASARARPYSTSTALRARCTHSVGNGPHPYLTPVAPPRPRPSSLAPSAHTLLSRAISLPASCPLLSPTRSHTHTRLDATPSSPRSFALACSQPYPSFTYTCAYNCMLFPSPISLHPT